MQPSLATVQRWLESASCHPIADIVKERRSITADTGLRLSKFFGMSDAFWVNLQAHYDLEVERDRLADALEKVSVYSA